MEKAIELLRRTVEDNATLVEALHQAHARGDLALMQELLSELDANNADLAVALEELEHVDRPPSPAQVDGRAVDADDCIMPTPF